MTGRMPTHRPSLLAAAALLCLGLAACEDEKLTDPGVHRVGDPAPELTLEPVRDAGLPRGSLAMENFGLVVDTAGQPDVFERGDSMSFYRWARSPRGYWWYYWFDGTHGAVRHAGTDPRLPALQPLEDVSKFSVSYAYALTPEYRQGGANIWDFWQKYYGLVPGRTYTFALVRYTLRVNGDLDHMEYLVDGEVSEPDELVLSPNRPGGYPDVNYAWVSTSQCIANRSPDPPANPWFLGVVRADGDGMINPDMCFNSAPFWYTRDASNWRTPGDPDSAVVARNDLKKGETFQYNYTVIFEGEPPNLGPPVLRIQMGTDLDAAGEPIPNAYAPFPLYHEREAALELPHVAAAPSRIRFALGGLEPLAGGTPYRAWLLNVETGAAVPAEGDYVPIETRIETDELGQQIERDYPGDTTRTASFQGVDQPNVRHEIVVRNRTIRPDNLGGFTHVVLARPGAGDGLEDPVLWAQFLDQAGTPDNPRDDIFITSDAFRFGRFDPADPAASREFRVSGAGDGAVWNDQLGLQFRRLSRPPPGYVYEAWLVDEAGGAASLGPLTGPAPAFEPLENADMEEGTYVTGTQILEAAKYVRLQGQSAFDLARYAEIRLTLEPKAGQPAMGPTTILAGKVPELLR